MTDTVGADTRTREVRISKNIPVPMRDGVSLATDLWLPGRAEPGEALLVRLPYGKDTLAIIADPFFPNLWRLLDAGYAIVIQDCRGTFGSEGEFVPMVDEPRDGIDTIDWIRKQPWCNGQVGTFGASYLGLVQWAVAAEGSEGPQAIAPALATVDYFETPWYSDGGAMSWHTVLYWSTLMAMNNTYRDLASGAPDAAEKIAELVEILDDLDSNLEMLPTDARPVLEKATTWWTQWLAHPSRDESWQKISVGERLGAVTAPAFHIAGWFDPFANNGLKTYRRMKTEGNSVAAREGQQLIVGPWAHGGDEGFTGAFRERQFGVAANPEAVDVTGAHIRFFDRWLRGRSDALDGTAPVRIFVMGINQWRDEQDWPLPDTSYVSYYLDSRGAANTADGDGRLSIELPAEDSVDVFDYDPRDPVRTVGGRLLKNYKGHGPADQRVNEARNDVLCFTTEVLTDPVEVTGHISLVLHVSSSALDTDFTGKLVDVFPDGRAFYLTEGIIRARYRNSLADPELLEPGKVYELTLDLAITSNVFQPGHRIRLEVSSSDFPRYDRNTNTGGLISADTADQVVIATNRVLHGPAHPSRLVLPIIKR
ncbi:CocE/NonD family hydrolase [Nocardia sp. R7R-8]|uniref:CocE/NonD family hydrolase n=1 Tax=Nocardia sp. R7R-8 TaxID=3459304 RepID=UPI00403E09B9